MEGVTFFLFSVDTGEDEKWECCVWFCCGDKHGAVWLVQDLFLGMYRLRFVITNLIVHYLTITEAK